MIGYLYVKYPIKKIYKYYEWKNFIEISFDRMLSLLKNNSLIKLFTMI